MHTKKGLPKRNELVVCTPTKILPHAVFVTLKEYENAEGMVHVSQISSKWVKNINSFFQIGRDIVCKVLFIKEGSIDLSLKAVTPADKTRKWNEWKAEVRAENILTTAAKSIGKTQKDMYAEVGNKALGEYGALSHFIDNYRVEGGRVFSSLGLSAQWSRAIAQYAAEKQKNVRISVTLIMKTLAPNGVNAIKNAFKQVTQPGVTVKYISSPEYLIEIEASDYKRAEKQLADLQKTLETYASKHAIEFAAKKR
ncbi:hypothetical protein COT72_05100 [archaeon CG10_big_fil_rev_8_21_14_0_10_43_11]|nr:MAG: hypothetical protein COT72_05100 [archaeon CG10_big_fil_rev_8_21_14_0_10_43_11]